MLCCSAIWRSDRLAKRYPSSGGRSRWRFDWSLTERLEVAPHQSGSKLVFPATRYSCLSAAKALRAYPKLSQISEVIFVGTRYQVFLPAFYSQPVLARG